MPVETNHTSATTSAVTLYDRAGELQTEPWFERVVAVAARWHGNQVDKAGELYIDHLTRTAPDPHGIRHAQ